MGKDLGSVCEVGDTALWVVKLLKLWFLLNSSTNTLKHVFSKILPFLIKMHEVQILWTWFLSLLYSKQQLLWGTAFSFLFHTIWMWGSDRCPGLVVPDVPPRAGRPERCTWKVWVQTRFSPVFLKWGNSTFGGLVYPSVWYFHWKYFSLEKIVWFIWSRWKMMMIFDQDEDEKPEMQMVNYVFKFIKYSITIF